MTVAKDATTTSITSTTSSPVVGQPILVDVKVVASSPGVGTPTGTVTVHDGGTQSCPASLTGGVGSCTIPAESVAKGYSFTASYAGDSDDVSSTSGTSPVVVGKDATTTTITSTSPASPVVGQPITIGVSVTPVAPGSGTPTGSVTVSDGGAGSCVVTLSGGIGNCQVAETAPGNPSFTASYAGDGNDLGSATSSGTAVTVAMDQTTTAITGATSTFVVGAPITVAVSVVPNAPGSGVPTGDVLVSDGTGQTCTVVLSAGTGSCPITETTAGDYSFTAGYGGDANDFSSDTATGYPITVGGDGTTTTITGATAGAVVGQPITVGVSVAADPPDMGVPTGTVTISDGGTGTCVADLSGGTGSCTITEAAAGSYTFAATYGGSVPDYASSNASGFGVTVSQDATTTSITGTTTVDPVVGESIGVSVIATASSPGSGTPTGTVTVSDGGTQTCVATLNASGAGGCQITEWASGPYVLSAIYGGDVNYVSSSTTAGPTLTVGAASTLTAITSATSSVAGQPITVAVDVAPVAPGAGTPTGTVTVSDGLGQSCPVALSAGTGSCQITEAAGSYSLSASYGGSSNYTGSATTSPFKLSVGRATSTVTLTGPTGSPVVGQPIMFTVNVTADSPGSGTPTGTVTVNDGGAQSCPVALTDGAGSCQITEMTASSYTFTASYGGDDNFVSSDNPTASVTIAPDPTTTTITNIPSAAVVGEPITVAVEVVPNGPGSGIPTGSVTVSDGGSKTCTATLTSGSNTGTCQITETTTAPYSFSAEYSTDGNYGASTSSAPDVVTVTKDSTTTAITNTTANPVVGQPVTVTVAVNANKPGAGTPTGTVTITDGGTAKCTVTLSGGAGSCPMTPPSSPPPPTTSRRPTPATMTSSPRPRHIPLR